MSDTQEVSPSSVDATSLIVDGIGAVKDLSAALTAIDRTVNGELRREVNTASDRSVAIESSVNDLKTSIHALKATVSRFADIEQGRIQAAKDLQAKTVAEAAARRRSVQEIAAKVLDSKPVQYFLLAVVIVAAQVLAARFGVSVPDLNLTPSSALQATPEVVEGE